MSSSIVISSAPATITTNSSGLYVPVHRRTPSASTPTFAPRSLPERAPHHPSRKSQSRSLSPAHTRRDVPSSAMTRIAPIPSASTIPNIYSLSDLLALALAPSVGLSHAQRAQVEAHVPFMTRKPRSFSPASASSAASSPSQAAAPLLNPTPVVLAESQKKAPAEQRRRRTGRKALNASAAAKHVSADRDSRRRRAAGWGWTHAVPLVAVHRLESDSWRAQRLGVAV